jgi:hydroxymethylpyrimidine pyrophosphatase-like HAD family hydrolase
MAERRKISLVLADVDGTLVTEQKVLTKRAQNAVSALQSAGIRFAITSGRPPRGMAMLSNKGAVVEYLSQHVGVPEREIATIGDQPNDVLMFKRSGFSIATGNASDEVKAQAAAVTDSYNDEGFAKAMEAFILGSAR